MTGRAKIRIVAMPEDIECVMAGIRSQFRVISGSKEYQRRYSVEKSVYLEVDVERPEFDIDQMAPVLKDHAGRNRILITASFDYDDIVRYGEAAPLNNAVQDAIRSVLGPLKDVDLRIDQSKAPKNSSLILYGQNGWEI